MVCKLIAMKVVILTTGNQWRIVSVEGGGIVQDLLSVVTSVHRRTTNVAAAMV